MALTNFMANAILLERFTNASPSQYVALHITDPTNAGLANTELSTVSAPNYARQPITWSAPVSRSVTNTNAIQWLALPVVSVGFLGIWNAATSGNLVAVLECDTPLEITAAGGWIRLPADSIAVVMGGSPGGRITPDGGLFPDLP